MKILFFNNIPSPYRVEFFNELGKQQEVKVIFEAERATHISNNWYDNNVIKNFQATFLKNGEMEEKKINWKVLKYIKRKNQDVIVVTNYAYLTEMIALILLKLKGIIYYLEVDGGIIKKENQLKKWYKTFLISGAYRYISSSKQTDDYLIYYGAKKEKIYRYHFTSLKKNDILKEPVSVDEKRVIREKLGIKEEKVILSVGRFIDIKGFDILIKSYKNIDKNVGLYIIGGNPTNEYISLIEKLKLDNIYFVDFMSKKELEGYYKAADIFVLPTRGDVWGLVVNEAMACGLPIITTDKCIAGLELVEDYENGFIVPVEGVEQLAEKINIILSNRDLRAKMSEKSLEKIRAYTIEKMADRHVEIFEKKCNNREEN
ncbi:glycosyltransferase family 4 protein [Clostridium estertheticum]|uniref:glycosyltransferase family 4 protein n=1 Tax=Clostridium estertheticum TaxID=238834 RepID=UPI001C0D8043|nr:glycosyltransferase family 4 protein [Clostridium estertheticum]MBU3197728.1 glycosyltransferase family 4 protein [Clostridium estertheticum]WAG65531.1 glycosyltransferase family 4 protein [Clostridium estertheticum]